MSMLQLPDTGNYFEFYGLETKYALDADDLKNRFLEKSRIYHPDLHMNDEREHQIAISASAFNNLAYKTLSGDVSRAIHLLELSSETGQASPTLPQAFLMEMLELNESIDEMNEDQRDAIEDQIMSLKKEAKKEIETLANGRQWSELRISVLKWKYLERLENRLTDF